MERQVSSLDQVSNMGTSNLTTPKSWNNIAPEMLTMVLSHLYSPTNPKEMASRRLVCKHWRNVIDEHFEYWLTVNDTKMNLEKASHVRVSNCTIVSLTNDLDPTKQIFKSSKSLTKLSFWGEISPQNFHLIIQQAVNVKHLSFNCIPLRIDGLMEGSASDQEERVQAFWDGLNTLEISQISVPEGIPLTDNLCQILSKSMQNLNSLKMRIGLEAPEWERFITAMYSFLGNNVNQNLNTFHFNWFLNSGNISSPESPLRLLGDNQLESLRLLLDKKLVPYWIPLIQAQRKLKDFRLDLTEFCDRPEFPQHTQLHQVLESTLPLNQETLETVELIKFNLTDELDANLFRGMEKLTRLVLRPCQFKRRYQKLLNLDSLPKSIETLVLGKVRVDSDELRLLVGRLDNIKVVEINGTQIEGEFVLQEVFEMLTRKEKIKRLTVNPLDDNFPRVFKNAKEYVIVNGYEMQVFWSDFADSINFTFP